MGDPSSVYSTPINKSTSTNTLQSTEPKATTMAGVVMNGQQPDKSIEKQPMSSYHYGTYKGQSDKSQPAHNRLDIGVHTPDASSDLEGRVNQQSAGNEPPVSGDPGAHLSRAQSTSGNKQKANGNKTTTKGYRRGPTAGLPQLSDRLLQSYRIRTKRQLAAKLTPLVDPRMYSNTQVSDSRRSHHEELMRRSMHRLVSETTRYDRVTGNSLSFLGDLARLYLMRIGEACRAHADFANRINPNLFDVMDCTSQELGIDWTSTIAWLSEWKDELGDATAATQSTINGTSLHSNEPPTHREHAQDGSAWTRETWIKRENTDDVLPRRLLSVDIGRQGPGQPHSTHSDPEGTSTVCNTDGGDDIEAIVDSLNLGCLLLDDMDMADGIKGVIPSHFPPLISLGGPDDKDDLSATKESQLPANRHAESDDKSAEGVITEGLEALTTSDDNDAMPTDRVHDERLPGADEDVDNDAEEAPESVIAQIIHLTSSSLSVLPSSVKSDKILYGFYRPATKFDSSCVPEENMPDFDIPDYALIPASEHVKDELSQIDKIQPGHPMFLVGDISQRDVIGDSEEVWRQARYRLYRDIHDDAAYKAFDAMNTAPEILRRTVADDREEEKQGQEKSNKMESGAAHTNEASRLDINIDDDVVDIDIGMGMDLDVDMDPDVDGNSQEENGVQLPSILQPVGTSKADSVPVDKQQSTERYAVDTKDHHAYVADNPEANIEDWQGEPETIPVPISSGLRGSGKPNWSSDWFTEPMRKRLSRITAHDIVPCDSLFLSNPWASHRGVVDEVARAFVNSEGGGHLHETTPIEGFGPAEQTFKVPSGSGSSLRWTLHHLMQANGSSTVGSLYTGRSSLAGGVSGDGVTQYVDRMCSLIKPSAEQEAEMVVSGSFRAAKDKDAYAWADRKVRPGQVDLMEQLLSGAEKRIPWAQNRMDIHVVESKLAGREPQRTETKPLLLLPLASAAADPSSATTESSTPAADATPNANNVNIDDIFGTAADDFIVDINADAAASDANTIPAEVVSAEPILAESVLAEDIADREGNVNADAYFDASVDVDVDVDIGSDSHTVDGLNNETTDGLSSPVYSAQQPETKSSPVLHSFLSASDIIEGINIDVGGAVIERDNQATEKDQSERLHQEENLGDDLDLSSVLAEYMMDEKDEHQQPQLE